MQSRLAGGRGPAPPRLALGVGKVVPSAVAACVFAGALRSLQLYRFARRQRLSVHLLWVLAAAVTAAVLLLLTDWLVRHLGPSLDQCLAWALVATVTMLAAHTAWWWRVCRWRRSGWLVPSVVIVGATAHAEQLIAEALRRRHVNVVGVFDDRRERAPAEVLGVPVLGDVDALLAHRITPFVDVIVVAIDPVAVHRVREIAARLATLPNEVALVVQPDGSKARAAALDRLEAAPLAPLVSFGDLE